MINFKIKRYNKWVLDAWGSKFLGGAAFKLLIVKRVGLEGSG